MVRISVAAVTAVAVFSSVAYAAVPAGSLKVIRGTVSVNSAKIVGGASKVATGDVVAVSTGGDAILIYGNGCKAVLKAGSVTTVDQASCKLAVQGVVAAPAAAGTAGAGGGAAAGAGAAAAAGATFAGVPVAAAVAVGAVAVGAAAAVAVGSSTDNSSPPAPVSP